MNLLKKINTAVTQESIVEDAAGGAVGAGGVAGGMAMPLFARLVQRSRGEKADDKDFEEEEAALPALPTVVIKKNSIKEHYTRLREFADDAGETKVATPDQSFDASGVIAKLKSLENKDSADHRDTVTFGLEDDNGGLVRVIVRHDQSEDFEKALQAMMAEEDDENARPEIAEVLFKLKDRFDFVDVQWPEVEEDEEEPVDLQGADGQPPEGDELDPNAMGDDMGMDDGGTAQVSDLLTQVIDMMKADAEARTADARAREAEAKNREAESIAKQASMRVKQEEQFLDMDMYNKSKKEEEKEAKRLAQLSKWKHEMGGQGGGEDDAEFEATNKVSLSAPEEEERSFRRPAAVRPQPGVKRVRGKLHPHDIANFIINRTRA